MKYQYLSIDLYNNKIYTYEMNDDSYVSYLIKEEIIID
jgi:hypothetical protein